jgi:hypothetical protein
MEITSTTLGYLGLTAAAVIAILLARPWRRAATNRFVNRSAALARPRSRRSAWFGSDPLLFVGAEGGSADCSAAADAGGGGCN